MSKLRFQKKYVTVSVFKNISVKCPNDCVNKKDFTYFHIILTNYINYEKNYIR